MHYAIAAIILVYGLLCLIWPEKVFRAMQGGFANAVSERYVRGSVVALRLAGIVILIAVPATLIGSPG